MLRRLGIRWKILAILAVPIAVLTAGATLISLTAVSESRTTRQVANLIMAAQDMRSVVESLQQERYASLRLIQSPETDAERSSIENELEQSRWLTDEALSALSEHIDNVDFEQLDERIFELVDETIEIHARLNVLRSRVDADSITEGAALGGYNDIIENDIKLASRLGGLIDQRDPAQFLTAYSTLDQTIEYFKQERRIGEMIIVNADRTERDSQDLQTLISLQDSLLSNAEAELAALDTDARIPGILSNLPSMRLVVQTGNTDALKRTDVDAWFESIDREIENIEPARVEVLEIASQRADTAADDARNQAILTIGGAAVAVLVSLLLALIVARGIVVPLRRLTGAAEKVRDDLPTLVEQVATPGVAPDTELERIPVESEDEIGKLAAAFNSVNETTVEVAREQAALRGSIAEMFVNVARRDQVLLNRQLSFITQLERTEEDPAQLEDLFRLDHLATRMRRNAESLLVLAGIDSGRRLRNPMAVSDVVRTASSEIEHYDRIDLVLTSDPAVLGHAALTLAHLLAELMENATVFSDPASRVEVMTAAREDGVTIAITDDGLGMDTAAVTEANEKIQFSTASDVIGAQRLGMFVVGRLSNRLGVQVRISSDGEGSGTRAEVFVPISLIDPASVDHADGDRHPVVEQVEQTAVIEAAHADTETYEPVGHEGLPVRSGGGLPARTPSAAQDSVAATAAPSNAKSRAPEERAGLFTGFRSVAENPLESLESVDAAALAAPGGQTYVPLVSEDRDFGGVTRESTTAISQPEVVDEPEVDPEIYSDPPLAEEHGQISYGGGAEEAPPFEKPDSAELGDAAAVEQAPADDEPATEVRVFTGAFPTATGEYPTYTGEIPVSMGGVRYPSRRSRREIRDEELRPTPAVDHHVEFEPIELADDEPIHPVAEEPVAPTETAQPVHSAPADSDFRPTTGGFPAIATPATGVAQPQPVGSFNSSVLPRDEKTQEPKRRKRGFFGRKAKAAPEPEVAPIRESRFPGGMTFTPQVEDRAPDAPAAAPSTQWGPQAAAEPVLPQRQTAFQPAENEIDEQRPVTGPTPVGPPSGQLPTRPAAEPAQASAWSPQVSPEPETPPPAVPPADPEESLPARQSFAPQTSWAPTSSHGALGAEAAEELRRRSAITSEVLSELSQLSAYKPEAEHSRPAASLTKRVPTQIPEQPEADTAPDRPARKRDASQVRSMLSGFQAGVNRAQNADVNGTTTSGREG